MSQGSNTLTYLSALVLLGALGGTMPEESLAKGQHPVAVENKDSTKKTEKMTPLEETFDLRFKQFFQDIVFATGNAYAINGKNPTADIATVNKAFDAAEKAYLAGIDPHSNYLTKEEFSAFMDDMGGQFGGLGMEISKDQKTGAVRVVAPIDDTPAQRAGIHPGDLIIGVGKKVPKDVKEAAKWMRGEPNTPVHLTLYREGEKKPIELDLTRQIIKTNPVKSAMIGNVGHVRIATFDNAATATKVKEAIVQLKAQNPNIEGYDIDVANNPGGLVNQGVDVSNLFLDKGLIVALKDRNGHVESSFSATKGDITDGKPIVVRINGGSASASEIFAGAMQGNHRATILGEQSFGKGSAQGVERGSKISNDDSRRDAVVLTNYLFYVSDGKGGDRSTQNIGITPDIAYQAPKDGAMSSVLDAIKEAGLEGTIANPNGDGVGNHTTTKAFCSAAAGADLQAKNLQKPLVDDDGKLDVSLLCAVNILDKDSHLKDLTVITPAVSSVSPTAMNLMH